MKFWARKTNREVRPGRSIFRADEKVIYSSLLKIDPGIIIDAGAGNVMLFINNGAPKSGTVWLHSILCHILLPYQSPDRSWWTAGWSGATVDVAKLPEYLGATDLGARTILFKAHYNPAAAQLLDRPDIKVVNCTRYLPDAVISMYHHYKRDGGTADITAWVAEEGMRFGQGIAAYNKGWSKIAETISYEAMSHDIVAVITDLSRRLGFPKAPDEARAIAFATSFDTMRQRIGSHAREGGVGKSKGKFDPDIFRIFDELDDYTDRSLLSELQVRSGV